MNQPNFVCGAINNTVEHPKSWERDFLVGEYQEITLGGTNVKDTTWRKYKYILKWDAIQKADFDKLLEIFEEHIDEGLDVIFTYQKWPSANSGVACKMSISPQAFRGGSGNTNYLSELTIELTEVNPR